MDYISLHGGGWAEAVCLPPMLLFGCDPMSTEGALISHSLLADCAVDSQTPRGCFAAQI